MLRPRPGSSGAAVGHDVLLLDDDGGSASTTSSSRPDKAGVTRPESAGACTPVWRAYPGPAAADRHPDPPASERRRALPRPDTPEAAMFEEGQLYSPVTRS